MIKVEGGGVTGQAGAIRHGIARALLQLDPETQSPPAAPGRPPHPRSADEGAQEVRAEARPQGPAVHEAVTPARRWRPIRRCRLRSRVTCIRAARSVLGAPRLARMPHWLRVSSRAIAPTVVASAGGICFRRGSVGARSGWSLRGPRRSRTSSGGTGGTRDPPLRGRTLAMLFQKPSLRTRVTFEAGMSQLGGHAIHLTEDVVMGAREAVRGRRDATSSAGSTRSWRGRCRTRSSWSSRPRRRIPVDQCADACASIPARRWPTCSRSHERFGDLAGRRARVRRGRQQRLPLAGADGRDHGHGGPPRASRGYGPNERIVVRARELAEEYGGTPRLRRRSARRGPRCGGDLHRRLDVDGPGGRGRGAPRRVPLLPGRRALVAASAGRPRDALPAGASGRGDHVRCDGRPAERHLRPVREPAARPEGLPRGGLGATEWIDREFERLRAVQGSAPPRPCGPRPDQLDAGARGLPGSPAISRATARCRTPGSARCCSRRTIRPTRSAAFDAALARAPRDEAALAAGPTRSPGSAARTDAAETLDSCPTSRKAAGRLATPGDDDLERSARSRGAEEPRRRRTGRDLRRPPEPGARPTPRRAPRRRHAGCGRPTPLRRS